MEMSIFSIYDVIIHYRNSILHTVCLSPAHIFLVNPTLTFRLIAPVSQAILLWKYRVMVGPR